MSPSSDCIALIQRFETCARPVGDGTFAAYLPTPNDRPTAGWGSTGADIQLGMAPWTQAQCDARFAEDLERFAEGISRAVDDGATTQAQFDAMTSLAYNIGLGNFNASTLLRLHDRQDYAGAAMEFMKWNHQDGVVLSGLTARRLAEKTLYLS